MIAENPKPLLYFADAVSGLAILGAMTNYVPTVAAIVGLLWYAIQIYESHTFQALVARARRLFDKPPPSE